MSLKKFSPKDPNESIILSFDFSEVLPDTSETITFAEWRITVSVGTDINAQSVLTGERGITDKLTSVLVTAGVNLCDYIITCTVTTSKNQVIEANGLLQIRNQV